MREIGNLKDKAFFKVEIYPKVYWVPYNCLGKTKYTNSEIKNFSPYYKKDSIKLILQNPYELAQYIKVHNFKKNIDICFKHSDGLSWEIHKPALDLLKNCSGCCATYSSFFYYVMRNYFDKVFTLCIVSNTKWGHAINFIIKNELYYFFDLSSQINEYEHNIPVESGIKGDFIKSKFITGICIETNNINNFINFFERYNFLKKREFFYYIVQCDCVPPISMNIENGILKIILDKSKIIDVIHIKNKKHYIEYSLI